MQYFFPSGPTIVIRFESGTVAAAILGVVVVGVAALAKGVVVMTVAVKGDCARAKAGGTVADDHCGREFKGCPAAGKADTCPTVRGGINRWKGCVLARFVTSGED